MLACLYFALSLTPSLSFALLSGSSGLGSYNGPQASPLFERHLETCLSRHFPIVETQGLEVCGAHPTSPGTRGLCPYPVWLGSSLTYSQSCPF